MELNQTNGIAIAENLNTDHLYEPDQNIIEPMHYMYPRFIEGINRLQAIYDGEAVSLGLRRPGLLIHGPSNCGKTTLGKYFQWKCQKEHNAAQSKEKPVVFFQFPAIPRSKLILDCILRGVGVVANPSHTIEKKFQQIDKVVNDGLGVRMLIADEIQHALNKGGDTDEALDILKYFSNEYKVPVVLMGVDKARRLVNTDNQHGSRSPLFPMKKLVPTLKEDRQAFVQLVFLMYRHWGFSKPTNKFSKSDIMHLIKLTDGLTGEIITFFGIAFEMARNEAVKEIDMNYLEKVMNYLEKVEQRWTPPKARRDEKDGEW